MGRIADHLFSRAAASPRAIAVEDAGGMVTYEELATCVTELRDELIRRYLPGTRVLVLLGNRLAQPVWCLAAYAAGLLPVVADPKSIGPSLDPLLDAFCPGLVVSEPDDARLPSGGRSLREAAQSVLARELDAPNRSTAPPGSYAAIVTSGSTGQPKGVLLSDAAWEESARRLGGVLGITSAERALHVASLAHGSGLLFAAVLLQGGTNVVLPKFQVGAVVDALATASATSTFLVPTMLYDLLEHPSFAPHDLPGLRTIYYSGGPASPSLVVRAAERWGATLIQDYGLIEAPAPQLVLGRADHELLARDPTGDVARSCGWALRPEELAIGPPTDEAGVGEVLVRGPTLCTGYLTDVGIDTSPVVDGTLRTGDLAFQDASGFVTIVGRTSNVIVSGGRKVSAEHVERVLGECDGVLEVGVTGIPDERWGEMLVAAVVLKDPITSEAALARFARERLAPHERPKRFALTDRLPKGPTGKVRRTELRDLAMRRSASNGPEQ